MEIPGTHALKPGDLFGFLLVGWADEVSSERTGCTQDTFKFPAGNDIGNGPITVSRQYLLVDGAKSGSEDDGAHIQLNIACLLVEIDRLGQADFLAFPAFFSRQVETGLLVNKVEGWYALGIIDVGRPPIGKAFVVLILYLDGAVGCAGAAGCTQILIDVSGVPANLYGEIAGFTIDR